MVFFLSNKDEDEGTQKTIKKQLKINKDEIINYNETLKKQPLELYPFYKQKIEKRLNELKIAPSIRKTLPEKLVLNKSHIVKTQKGITPLKCKIKLQTPTIKPNEPIKKTLKDSKKLAMKAN